MASDFRFRALGLAFVLLAGHPAAQGVKDAVKIFKEPDSPRPALFAQYQDAAFGSTIARVTDADTLGVQAPVHQYSQLPAWNSDQSLILLNVGVFLDAKTFKSVHKVNYGWPAEGAALRWSPTEPLVLYYAGLVPAGQKDPDNLPCAAGRARLMRYRLERGNVLTARRELVHCFEEYTSILKDQSHEALSDDGRILALVARKADGSVEAFVYDIEAKMKHTPLVLPVQGGTQRIPDWAGASPSGKYVLIMWGKGMERYRGMEAYDARTMTYVGKITASSGHGDLTMDENGVEYYVYSNANNAYYLSGSHYLVKSRIPVGVVVNGQGGADLDVTLGSGASVPLVILDWGLGLHVSCRNINTPSKYCVVSTTGGSDTAWKPFQREVFKVSLASTVPKPQVERLAHHRSDVSYVAALPIEVCPVSNYWTQPHAVISADGSAILFGSSWGKACRADLYQINLDKEVGIRPVPKSPSPSPSPRLRGKAIPGGTGLRLQFTVPGRNLISASPRRLVPVRMDLRDSRGALVKDLYQGELASGEHELEVDIGSRVEPGVYWCIFQAAAGTASIRIPLPMVN